MFSASKGGKSHLTTDAAVLELTRDPFAPCEHQAGSCCPVLLSQKSKKIQIQIVNPVHGCGLTSLAHARRYVRAGRAEFIVESGVSKLRFHEKHHAHQSSLRRSKIVHQSEGPGMATLGQVQGLPVAGPAITLFRGRRSPNPVQDYAVIELDRHPLPVAEWR